jgi:hypothetical protein
MQPTETVHSGRERHPLCVLIVAQEPSRHKAAGFLLVVTRRDGETSVGDYVSTRAYPVLTRGFPDQVETHVHPVG